MKTLKKSKVKKLRSQFVILNTFELKQIKGGDEATPKGNDFD